MGSPPRFTVTAEKGTPSIRISSAMAEGTVSITRTSFLAGNWGRARAFSARITVPPQARGAKISNTDMSKVMEVEARTPDSSRSENSRRDQSTMATALLCSMATALGRPVEPEV
jgi:hypothetical protein